MPSRTLRLSSTLALLALIPIASLRGNPTAVTVAGNLQSEIGCVNDWDPSCGSSGLKFDAEDDVWQATFNVPAGSWEYKAALNGSWDENYGANAQRNGANIGLSLASPTAVKFYYDHKTHWIADSSTKTIVTAPGSYQSKIGCGGDWQPDCLRSWLQDPDGDGVYSFSVQLPAGDYETKAAINESWNENYGAGGVQNGPNVPFTVSAECGLTTFTYNASTRVLSVGPPPAVPQPSAVTIPGNFQSAAGCGGDWDPGCAATALTYDAADNVWQGTFDIAAGNWEYKVAINQSWDENYGANATRNGANLQLSLTDPQQVKFYYDHATHWVADQRTKVIATAPGNYQSEIGCPGDWQPDCLRSWLQDPDGDGIYTFTTRGIAAGDYEVKVAINESWSENYGADGARDGANVGFTVPSSCAEVSFSYDAATHVLTVGAVGAPRGDLKKAQAHWVMRDTIAWNPTGFTGSGTVALHSSATGGLALDSSGVTDGSTITLTADPAGLDASIRARFPHLAGSRAFRIPAGTLADVPEILKGQIAISAADTNGNPLDATSLQIPGVLDDLYTYDGALGIVWNGGVPTLKLWAPTARSVNVQLFADASPSTPATVHAMTLGANGVWSIAGESSWNGKYYVYDVEVFVASTGRVEHNLVTDPYSASLSANSARSEIVDLSNPALQPAGWSVTRKPRLDAPEDIVLYELHVRDFSASDESVPQAHRGTFKAFTETASNGMRHLASLAQAGLTHVHLLPAFDIASINEDRSQWKGTGDLSGLSPESHEQQAAVAAIADEDGYNWGYDPWHYTVPEGSYATDPDGAARIVEFREMVQSLASIGLRTVMDVVYNHTNASGQNARSVLDRIVPGYYHRLNADGAVERSTCCDNTATEHNMMEKLMVDSLVTWAKAYKVDGFRFDLMGHHMKRNMLAVRQALDALTIEQDGVDGRNIYLYGEAWNFGEVANNARGENAIQSNMAGTGIGSFNDRLRDGARGGGPFSGLQEQGFVSGLFSDPNATNQGSASDQRNRLLQRMDWIRAGLAANLANYSFVDRFGETVRASDVDYNGQRAGYTADPQETINYVEAHDNETLFDALQLKLPVTAPMSERGRSQKLGMSLLLVSQGVPFLHAGMEALRSKSLDRNSYNSGDWFNRLDFTYSSNNWGVGLPPERDNGSNWDLFRPLLANPELRPSPAHISEAVDHLREMLAIRKSTGLFRLRTADDVQRRLRMLNTGANQIPGLLALQISDADGGVDRRLRSIVALLNATPAPLTLTDAALAGRSLTLHPIQISSKDPLVRSSAFDSSLGAFSVPGRTTAVFVERRPSADRIALLEGDVDRLGSSGQLAAGEAASLRAKLRTALDALAGGRKNAAQNALRAFANELEALVRSRRLSANAAEPMLTEAAALAEEL